MHLKIVLTQQHQIVSQTFLIPPKIPESESGVKMSNISFNQPISNHRRAPFTTLGEWNFLYLSLDYLKGDDF